MNFIRKFNTLAISNYNITSLLLIRNYAKPAAAGKFVHQSHDCFKIVPRKMK